MHDHTDTAVNQKTLVVLGVPVDLLATTLSDCSDTTSVSVSSDSGYTTPIKFQEYPIGSSHPTVSRSSHLHIFDPEELYSILLVVTQTLETPTQL